MRTRCRLDLKLRLLNMTEICEAAADAMPQAMRRSSACRRFIRQIILAWPRDIVQRPLSFLEGPDYTSRKCP